MMNRDRTPTNNEVVAVRAGMGAIGWAASVTAVAFVVAMLRAGIDVVSSGLTFASFAALFFGLAIVMICGRFLRRARRAGGADGAPMMTWDHERMSWWNGDVGRTESASWSDVRSVAYGYEDAGGFPLWHLWTVELADLSRRTVRSPFAARGMSPPRIRREIERIAPHVVVSGSWRDPDAPDFHFRPECAGTAPPAPPASMVVRCRFGLVATLGVLGLLILVPLLLASVWLAVVTTGDDAHLWTAGVALVGIGTAGTASLLLRMARMGGKTQLWLAEGRLGFRSTAPSRPGSAPWSDIVAVEYSDERNQAVVHTHRWTIRFTDRPPVTVQYPAGAAPRPWRIRRRIRRIAPQVDVSGGWW